MAYENTQHPHMSVAAWRLHEANTGRRPGWSELLPLPDQEQVAEGELLMALAIAGASSCDHEATYCGTVLDTRECSHWSYVATPGVGVQFNLLQPHEASEVGTYSVYVPVGAAEVARPASNFAFAHVSNKAHWA